MQERKIMKKLMKYTTIAKRTALITTACLTVFTAGMVSGCGQSGQQTASAQEAVAAHTAGAQNGQNDAQSGQNSGQNGQNDAQSGQNDAQSSQPADKAENQIQNQSSNMTSADGNGADGQPATLPDTSEARPLVVTGEKTLGDTGRTFVNDYNPSDRSYAASDNYISPKGNMQYGTTTTVEYYSSTLGAMRKADVILPYGYDASKSYPVLYMLHGMGGSNKSWSDMGVKYIVENVHYENGVPDMIIVCVDCFVSTLDQGSVSIREMGPAYDLTDSEIMNDLMPYINSNYSTKTGRSNTAIAGYSLGGRNALAIGFRHQDQFGYIGAFSAASGVIPNPSGRSVLTNLLDDFVLDYGDFPMLLINVGETDGICGDTCRFYDDALTQRGIKHIFYEMEGDHEGTVWQNGLYNFVKRIFV